MMKAPMEEDLAIAPALRWTALGWSIICPLVFLGAAILAYRPSLDSPGEIVLAILPLIVLGATMTALLGPLRGISSLANRIAVGTALGGWAILMFDNSDWWFLTFVLFALCYTAGPLIGSGPWVGVVLAGIVSIVWTLSWVLSDEPAWLVLIPACTFMIGALISLTIFRAEQVNDKQADLIHQLTATREALAASERTKGVLEERARFASEIHDTLAQGFASIVLLSRAAQRTNGTEESWASVEATALENLGAARRLVEAVRPPELDTASLPDALDRQINVSLPEEVTSRFQVIGEPRSLNGTVEVTLLRATQEALLNVKQHAEAQNVHVTLSYLDGVVALDVRDDGVGFVAGETNDRGQLTGGQGLQVLEDRARSLSGELTIEALQSGGSVISVLLPAAGP